MTYRNCDIDAWMRSSTRKESVIKDNMDGASGGGADFILDNQDNRDSRVNNLLKPSSTRAQGGKKK